MKLQAAAKAVTEAQRVLRTLLGSGMTREEIAVALLVSSQSVRRWETGQHTPIPGALRRLLALGKEKER